MLPHPPFAGRRPRIHDSAHAHGHTHKLRQYALNNQSPDRLLSTQPVHAHCGDLPAAREGFLRCHHGPSAARPSHLGTRLTWSCWFPRLAVAMRLASVPSAICGGNRILAAHHCHNRPRAATPTHSTRTSPGTNARCGAILGVMTSVPGPLIVQSDHTLLLEVDHPQADECRHAIAPFAELERAPEHIHTYRLTPLGLWNAMAAGHDEEQVVDILMRYSRYPVASGLLIDVTETMSRYGRLRIEKHPTHGLVLVSTERAILTEVLRSKSVRGLVGNQIDDETAVVHPSQRGTLKQALLKLGWPAEDLAGYVDGEHHDIDLDEDGWSLRPYQKVAAQSFWDLSLIHI